MTNDEAITKAMLYGLEPWYYGRHASRDHDVWYARKPGDDAAGGHPAEKIIGADTSGAGPHKHRYYFISHAEACHYLVRWYEAQLPVAQAIEQPTTTRKEKAQLSTCVEVRR